MTTLDPTTGYVVLINIFTIEPDKADDLLGVLSHATEAYMRHVPGFVSANFHVSLDKRHVANYAQWRSQSDLDAMMADPKAREHMQVAARLAESFSPILYSLRETHAPALTS